MFPKFFLGKGKRGGSCLKHHKTKMTVRIISSVHSNKSCIPFPAESTCGRASASEILPEGRTVASKSLSGNQTERSCPKPIKHVQPRKVAQFLAHSTGRGFLLGARVAISERRMSKLGPSADRFSYGILERNSCLERRKRERDTERKKVKRKMS